MNVYQAPQADLFWMTPEERLAAALERSARRWTAAATAATVLLVAIHLEGDPAFLLAHGAAALLLLPTAAGLAATGAGPWMAMPLPGWIGGLLLRTLLVLGAGLGGTLAAAALLAATGHPRPLGPFGLLGAEGLARALAGAGCFALADCAAWAVCWRWRLARRGR